MGLEATKTRLKELNVKEKVGIGLAFIVIVFAVWDFAIYQPMLEEETSLLNSLEQNKKNIELMSEQIRKVVAADKTPEYRKNSERLKSIKRQIDQIEKGLLDITSSLIAPEQMAKVLETLLAESKNLTIREMQGLGTKPYPENNKSDVKELDKSVDHNELDTNIKSAWQHGLRIEFSGTYLDTMNYLKSLEELDWKFYWDSVELEVDEYPRVNTAIKVYTLSLDEGWIGV